MMWPNYSLWLNYSHIYMLKHSSENPAPLCMATRWARWQFVDRGELQGVTRLSLGCWPPPLFPLKLPPSSPTAVPSTLFLLALVPAPLPLPFLPTHLSWHSHPVWQSPKMAPPIFWIIGELEMLLSKSSLLVTFADKEVFFFFQQNFSIAL